MQGFLLQFQQQYICLSHAGTTNEFDRDNFSKRLSTTKCAKCALLILIFLELRHVGSVLVCFCFSFFLMYISRANKNLENTLF